MPASQPNTTTLWLHVGLFQGAFQMQKSTHTSNCMHTHKLFLQAYAPGRKSLQQYLHIHTCCFSSSQGILLDWWHCSLGYERCLFLASALVFNDATYSVFFDSVYICKHTYKQLLYMYSKYMQLSECLGALYTHPFNNTVFMNHQGGIVSSACTT